MSLPFAPAPIRTLPPFGAESGHKEGTKFGAEEGQDGGPNWGPVCSRQRLPQPARVAPCRPASGCSVPPRPPSAHVARQGARRRPLAMEGSGGCRRAGVWLILNRWQRDGRDRICSSSSRSSKLCCWSSDRGSQVGSSVGTTERSGTGGAGVPAEGSAPAVARKGGHNPRGLCLDVDLSLGSRLCGPVDECVQV
jgi:hypothetical protein